MEKLKYILLSFVIFMTNCNDEDVIKDGIEGEWYYWIVNGTEHTIKLKIDRGININNFPEIYEIPSADSIVNAEVGSFNYRPFDAFSAFVMFDDTLIYRCELIDSTKEEKYGGMFLNELNYEVLTYSQTLRVFRYEFTEKEYEFAKAHPYKLEEE